MSHMKCKDFSQKNKNKNLECCLLEIIFFFFFFFLQKICLISLDISCESQTIHIKCHELLSLKKKNK